MRANQAAQPHECPHDGHVHLDGSIRLETLIELAKEYRAFKNVGLGIGLNSNSLTITEDASEYKFVFDNRISGILVYAAAYF